MFTSVIYDSLRNRLLSRDKTVISQVTTKYILDIINNEKQPTNIWYKNIQIKYLVVDV